VRVLPSVACTIAQTDVTNAVVVIVERRETNQHDRLVLSGGGLDD
jgi:hypothetical protein